MAETPESRKWVDEKRKLIDQHFIEPKLETPSFPTDPWTPFFRTNNFIQQTLTRLLGYNPDTQKWYPLYVDQSGRILTSPLPTDGLQVYFKDREAIIINILENEQVPAGFIVTHAGEDVEEFFHKTILISTTDDATIYIQCSDNDQDWYDLKSVGDADRSYNCNNEKIAIPFDFHTKYIRIVIKNNAATTNTICLKILGAV